MLYYRVKAQFDGAERGTFANRINIVKDEILTAEECEKYQLSPNDVEAVEVKKHWIYRFFGARFYDEDKPRRWYSTERSYTVAGKIVLFGNDQTILYGYEPGFRNSRTVFRKTRAGWVEATGVLTADAFYHGIKRGTVKLAESAADAALV